MDFFEELELLEIKVSKWTKMDITTLNIKEVKQARDRSISMCKTYMSEETACLFCVIDAILEELENL